MEELDYFYLKVTQLTDQEDAEKEKEKPLEDVL